jgi:hypothetical protein
MKSDFQRQELLLADFPKMKSDFQRQELLLANFPKMKSDFQRNLSPMHFRISKNSCMQCMKGPKVILE